MLEYIPPTEPWIDIIYEDEHILAANKPSGGSFQYQESELNTTTVCGVDWSSHTQRYKWYIVSIWTRLV